MNLFAQEPCLLCAAARLQLARQLFQRANGAFPTVVPKDGAGRLMPELFSGWEV